MAIDVADLIRKGRLVNKRIDEMKERHKAELAELSGLGEDIRNTILAFLQETGQQNAKTQYGTAYQHTTESFKVEDQAEFRHHVIGTEAWELIEWRANRTGVRAFEQKYRELPPGMTKSVLIDCRLLAPEKPRLKIQSQTAVEAEVEPAGPTGFE